jgi:hypothetical protein
MSESFPEHVRRSIQEIREGLFLVGYLDCNTGEYVSYDDVTAEAEQIQYLWDVWRATLLYRPPPPWRPIRTPHDAHLALDALGQELDRVFGPAPGPVVQGFQGLRMEEADPGNPADGADDTTAPAAGKGERRNDEAAASVPDFPFDDFPTKRRRLLAALWHKGKVTIAEVLKAVYGTAARDGEGKLRQLVKNTNAALAEANSGLEIARKGDTLRLRPV